MPRARQGQFEAPRAVRACNRPAIYRMGTHTPVCKAQDDEGALVHGRGRLEELCLGRRGSGGAARGRRRVGQPLVGSSGGGGYRLRCWRA
eukprot:2219470-Prymnesium_polylepis.1